MGKPRRPRRPRFTWDPKLKPSVDADGAALRAVPPLADTDIGTDTAIPASAIAKATADAGLPGPDAAPEPPVAAYVPPVTAEPAPHGAAAGSPTGIAPAHGDDIGTTIARYMQAEGAAAVAHLRALSQAGSPTELFRLQMSETQRAADASLTCSLTCWSDLMRQASRLVAPR